MDASEIISLLEKPTKNRWPFMYNIRDEATTSDIVTALRTRTTPLTRRILSDILGFRAEVGIPDTKRATPALVEALHDANQSVRNSAADALSKIAYPADDPALLEQYHKEQEGSPVPHMR